MSLSRNAFRSVWSTPSFELRDDSVGHFIGDEMVGFASLSHGEAFVEVSEDHNSEGIGDALCHWLTQRVRSDAHSGGRVLQELAPANTEARQLLQRHGYVRSFESWVLRLPAGVAVEERAVSDVTIRVMSPGEERAVHALIEVAFSEWEGRVPVTLDDWRARTIESREFEPEGFLVACKAGRIVGACVAVDDHSKNETWVAQLAVESSERRRGLGQALLHRAWAESRGRGREGLVLATNSRTSALSFYRRIGMEISIETETWRLDVAAGNPPATP